VRSGNELIAVLPLYVQRQRVLGPIGISLLRPVGTGGDTSPDYLGPLIAADYEKEAEIELARFLSSETSGWDVLRLSDLNSTTTFETAIAKACEPRGWRVRRGVSAAISYVSLPKSWDDYLNSLSRERRYTIRNTRRKFEALPESRFFVMSDSALLDQAIDRLIELHHRRWEEKDEPHAFSSPRYVAFHRELMHACLEKTWLRMYCLELAGEIIAIYYCYRFRDTVYYFQGGFDPARSKLRPGLVLMGYAIEHALNEGNTVFDMLRGEYEYKTQWAKEVRETRLLEAQRATLTTFAHRLRHEQLPLLKRYLKSLRAESPPRTAGSEK
jgi:CelD/BcsL family acetyltransferase involved in cellulose biosynthesis